MMSGVSAESTLKRVQLNLKRAIATALRFGGSLLVVFIASCVVWGVLAAMGDEAGAGGAQAATLIVSVTLLGNLILLVVLLALSELNRK